MKLKKFAIFPAGLAVTALALAACGETNAEGGGDVAFPTQSVTITVPYPAGGGLDIAARTMEQCFESELGEGVVIENREGGSGAVGTNHMLSQPADGHNMQIVLTSSAVVTPLTEDVGYTLEDLRSVGQIASFPYVLLTAEESDFETVEDMVESNSQLTAAAPGAASQGDLELQLLQEAGLDMSIVPFDGTAGVRTAVMGGNVDIGTAVLDNDLLRQHEDGTIRILASLGDERSDYLPDIPTMNELSGFEELGSGTSYFSFVTHQEVPDAAHDVLAEAMSTCLQSDDVQSGIGESFVAEEFVEGSTVHERFQEQSEVYGDLIDAE